MVDGKVHWFGVAGIANGLAVMRDEESGSLWDHITGECFEGENAGKRLDFWYAQMTTVAAELNTHPDTILLKSDYRSLGATFINQVAGRKIGVIGKQGGVIKKEGTFLAPHFMKSMSGQIDPRLPEGEQGLGVMDDANNGKFYSINAIPKERGIEDVWQGRPLRIELGKIDGVPFATWLDADDFPMQLLTRWYGFAFTYPNCDIYGQ